MIDRQPHSEWVRHLAAFFLALAALACNSPLGGSPAAPPESTGTPTVHAGPAVTSTEEASSPSPPAPSDTAEVLDPLTILDTYASLAAVRQRLDSTVFTHKTAGTTVTARELLVEILVHRQYDPTADNGLKEQVFAVLDDYNQLAPPARIYLVNVATGLFAEAHGLYPWSLEDYSAREIEDLFIEDSSLTVIGPTLHRGNSPADMPNLQTHSGYPMDNRVIEDAHYKQFNLARHLAQGATTQEEAVAQIVVWMQQNFFHAVEGYGWEVYLDGRQPRADGGPVAYPLSLERIYEERVIGCHEPTILLEGMLHSLNIPAVRLKVHGHGVLYLPTLDRYIHGDHVANYTDPPPGVLLLTPDEFRPYAEDVAMIFQIYLDKYRCPLVSMPLTREGDYLTVQASRLHNYPDLSCIVVSDEDWARLSQQLAAYNIQYDTVSCELSSDRVPILTLDELNDPASW